MFWGLVLRFAGEALIALSVILVHSKITNEKRIDGIVLMEMRRECNVAIIGLVLMSVGFLLEATQLGFI